MARLLLFAAAREAAGCREAEIPATSLGEALDVAVERFGPDFGRVLSFCSLLVDESTVPRSGAREVPVAETTEIAVLPPVSGGQQSDHDHAGPIADRTGGGGGSGATMRVAVLTVSDAGAAGQRADESGPVVAQMVAAAGFPVVATEMVPDEQEVIEAALCRWADDANGRDDDGVGDDSSAGDDNSGVDLVLTTGGTGLGPRDVTPEATRAVVDREVPGIPEAMRAAGMRVTPLASLARQVAGQRGATLIVNLPGSPKAARESLDAVMAALPHAVSLVRASARPQGQ